MLQIAPNDFIGGTEDLLFEQKYMRKIPMGEQQTPVLTCGYASTETT